MTKEKKVVETKQEFVDHSRDKQMVGDVAPITLAQEMLLQQDFSALEIAKLNRKVALKEAEKALAQNESAEMAFKYIILQLYMKYKLDVAADAISDDGKIMRGALLNQAK